MTETRWRPLPSWVLLRYRMFATMRCMHAISDMLRLANRYAGAKKIARSTLARTATGSSTWFDRCATGRVTIRSAVAVVQWLSDHWPEGTAWPIDIPRPEPAPDSPAAAHFAPSTLADDCLGAVRRSAWQAVRRAEGEMIAAAMRLGPSGRIASPAAFCRALGVRRHVYDDVVRRYRDEIGAGRWPRAGNGCDRVLSALAAAGDVRFASRRARAAA